MPIDTQFHGASGIIAPSRRDRLRRFQKRRFPFCPGCFFTLLSFIGESAPDDKHRAMIMDFGNKPMETWHAGYFKSGGDGNCPGKTNVRHEAARHPASGSDQVKKSKAGPHDPALRHFLCGCCYFLKYFLVPAIPIRPIPKRSIVVGSGTDGGGPCSVMPDDRSAPILSSFAST